MKKEKLLIANRGEIAIRIARTAKRMGFTVVGLYSKIDDESLHLRFCDEVYDLGDGPLAETYLNIPKIVEIIKVSDCAFVHPGYGFLSERAAFAQACADAGAVFVGPSPSSIEAMGDKIRSKQLMKSMGVPLVPGSEGAVTTLSDAKKIAAQTGFPVLLKASAGGGGKGMRIVQNEKDLESALESASREAKNYFGDGTVFIEKYLTNPHHVEVQVLGDGKGGGGHVFDRECSIQRRHQKLLEESPAPLLERFPEQKKKILEISNRVVSEMKYASAGTLEFVADDEGNFYFLEMNTRLQVEHPVTEWVTGLDLVEMQLKVAQGATLPKGALALTQNGYAIEVRIYAETSLDHLPTGGKVHDVVFPQGAFVRVDSAIYPGYDVPTDYDPTLLKLSVWGNTRDQAIARLRASLEELRILGVDSNQALFWAICQEPEFNRGTYGTPYLEKNKPFLRKIIHAEEEKIHEQLHTTLLVNSLGSVDAEVSNSFGKGGWNAASLRQGVEGAL